MDVNLADFRLSAEVIAAESRGLVRVEVVAAVKPALTAASGFAT